MTQLSVLHRFGRRRHTSLVWVLLVSIVASSRLACVAEDEPQTWSPEAARAFELHHGPFGRATGHDAPPRELSAARRRLGARDDGAAEVPSAATLRLGREIVARRFLGHQSSNKGKGLGDRTQTYQKNEYFNGEYPYLHTSVVGHSETSPLGGDWDMSYLEPYPSSRVVGNADASANRAAVLELFESQRGLNIVTMLDSLFESLKENYCTNVVDGIKTDRVQSCEAFLSVLQSTWRRIGDAVCGAVAWPALRTLPTAEKLERIFAECTSTYDGDVESVVVALVEEVLAERLASRPDVKAVLELNAAVARGGNLDSGTGWRLNGWGVGQYAHSKSQAQVEAWQARRKQPSHHRLQAHTEMLERMPAMRALYNAEYRTHPSPHATYHADDKDARLMWSHAERRWCRVAENARFGYRDKCID